MPDSPILLMQGIRKAFPGVQALDSVDFEVKPGEVMALVGENGAGKSTLIKILAGAQIADEGKIYINGEEVKIINPRFARQLGIAVIYQELNLAEHISVAENIFIGREFRTKLGFIDYPAMYKNARKWLNSLHININPHTEVRKLSIARKQMVEIAKALSLDANIIVMDEPTSSLPTTSTKSNELNEVQVLINLILKLRERGKAVIYISHRMNEIFLLSDRITVLRDGRLVGVRNTAETNPDEIISLMVGRKLEDLYGNPETNPTGKPVLEVQGLQQHGHLHNIDFCIRSGEILGVAGLVGAGRSEMARAIFGADHKDAGEVIINEKRVNILSPQDAISAGIGFIPEDRKLQGLFLKMALGINITAANLGCITSWGFIQNNKENEISHTFVKQLNIHTPSIKQRVGNLSGGNQQKVVIAKWLVVHPKVLIMDEPTRGIDVGAKMEIYQLMRTMARQNVAIIMISSELPEVLGMSDRIIVLREGYLAGEFSREEATEEKIMALATGSTAKAEV